MDMNSKQEEPFCIQVELSEGCNLYCSFCGLQGIRTKTVKDYKFMTVEVARTLAKQIAAAKWNARIEFAMHGEPTMNPNWINIIGEFREALPKSQIMLCSNGGGILKDPVGDLNIAFKMGLNVFALDCYESVKLHEKIREKIQLDFESPEFEMYEYPEDKGASPHKRWPKNARSLVMIADIDLATDGTHATLNNHAGSAFPKNDKGHGKRCAKVFREISVRWDGSIAICCNDWRGQYKCGNIKKTPINEIWQNEAFTLARKFLIRGERSAINVCSGCDAVSYRVGLLPDKKGKVVLPVPTMKDRNDVKMFEMFDPLTIPVKRIYE